MTAAPGDARADRVAARATGVGVGLLPFMLAWLVGVRVTEQLWGPPSSAVVAMAIAVATGIVVSVVAGRRLVHRQLRRHTAVVADECDRRPPLTSTR